jgi:hypothetical protein
MAATLTVEFTQKEILGIWKKLPEQSHPSMNIVHCPHCVVSGWVLGLALTGASNNAGQQQMGGRQYLLMFLRFDN